MVHKSNYTKEWLNVSDVDVLNLPAKSSNLYIIENAWSVLARRVYHGGRKFENIKSLQEAIMAAWNSIFVSYLQNIYRSTRSRIVFEVQKMVV